MITVTDFLEENNRINWGAYKQALRDAGEECSNCSARIANPSGVTSLCASCVSVGSTSVICPSCGHKDQVDQLYDPSLYEAGVHEIICTNCTTQYQIETRVSYYFACPTRFK